MSAYRELKESGNESKDEKEFFKACTSVGIKPTTRQLKKWKRKEGLAYMKGREQ